MITAVIRATCGPDALVATLSALVPAVAAGLVADAVIVATAPDETLERIADAAGATLLVGTSWRDGAHGARRDWVLCLDAGDLPQGGWIRVIDRFVSLNGGRTVHARLRRRQPIFRMLLDLLRDRIGPNAIRAGDLVRRDIALGLAKAGRAVRVGAAIERESSLDPAR